MTPPAYPHRHLLGIEPLEPSHITAVLDTAEALREVLVLAADNGRGEHVLLMPERPVPDGGRVS